MTGAIWYPTVETLPSGSVIPDNNYTATLLFCGGSNTTQWGNDGTADASSPRYGRTTHVSVSAQTTRVPSMWTTITCSKVELWVDLCTFLKVPYEWAMVSPWEPLITVMTITASVNHTVKTYFTSRLATTHLRQLELGGSGRVCPPPPTSECITQPPFYCPIAPSPFRSPIRIRTLP